MLECLGHCMSLNMVITDDLINVHCLFFKGRVLDLEEVPEEEGRSMLQMPYNLNQDSCVTL
jgi:hypothetical protein